MAAEQQPARVFRFGPFEADLGNRQLFRNGVSVSLPSQPFEVLALLLEHPGHLVTREQLRARLWPSGTIVEFDHSIDAAITRLREVLGDQAQHPRFIATVPRHGYRFIAPTSTPAPTAPKPSLATSSQPELQWHTRPARLPWLRLYRVVIIVIVVLAVGVAWLFVDKLSVSRHSRALQPPASSSQQAVSRPAAGTLVAFNPPPHSVAVLPFANLNGDREQEYFSDGLTEELLTALTRINQLQVAAQTSSFYFKGRNASLDTIARQLNVSAVLEGSVRRSGHRLRITAQLIDAVTGYHLWSQTYDRNVGEVLSLQTEIATAVASALKVTLLRDVSARVELGGTRNPAAFDAYLRASKAYAGNRSAEATRAAIDGYTEATRLDPSYALAFAARSLALSVYADIYTQVTAIPGTHEKARLDAQKALALAPALAEGHLALARYFAHGVLNFTRASVEYERAMAFAPGSAPVLRDYGRFNVSMGRTDAGLVAARRAVMLDPLNPSSHGELARALYQAHRFKESVVAFNDSLTLNSETAYRAHLGLAYYELGDFQQARASCEPKGGNWSREWCLALTYEKLGRHADAEAELGKMKALMGDAEAFQYSTIYAQWGNTVRALEWLDTALRLRDAGLVELKAEPLLDPLRKEPRFQEIERQLKFPN
jgi:TolB-like protein/DNA-binding winged helix-turn-helix (wHTH) protein